LRILRKCQSDGKTIFSVQGIPQGHKLVAYGRITSEKYLAPEEYFVITANKDNSQFFNNCNVSIGGLDEILNHVQTYGMEKERAPNGYFKVRTEQGTFSFKLPDPTQHGQSDLDGHLILCMNFQLPN